MASPLRLALIYGSAREGRFCDVVGAWAQRRVARHGGFDTDLIDPLDWPLSGRPSRADEAQLQSLRQRLDAADAFLIVTPEYNHGYPAPLKALIDACYEPWRAKPVAFVSYGASSGGLRAIEQLRQVFGELHAATLRDCVCLAHAWRQFGPDGELREPQAAHQAMEATLARLRWWALALRDAREAMPYEAAA
ncbi:NADPH-dependent FMN reductase [Lysobacter enzymogenes]|uniref:NADPH-dependent FMN reductase n=1 Tax=Lysobacter enzymogenes TaxID=69 RepID=UPI001A97BC94|nr:NAD(P)H-dependent oxidoreductase [Lysobacter enzymogenes]QQP94078.1 NAD(P)H-dependent oxidoreductase [Lysobacter enzymogenes]